MNENDLMAEARASEMKVAQERAAAEHARRTEEAWQRALIESQRQREAGAFQAVEEERARAAFEQARKEQEAAEKAANNDIHQVRINSEAVRGLVWCPGLSNEQARAVIIAIARNKIPHVRIEY